MTPERPAFTAERLLEQLPQSPDLYPQKIDLVRDAVLVVEFDRAKYRAASFLDDRILGPATRGGWLPIRAVGEAAQSVRDARPLAYIFHTGHVGSTLVSRLLDETGTVLSLREPLTLRNLADASDELDEVGSLLSPAAFGSLLQTMVQLWGRSYPGTRVVLKATSSAARLAPRLLATEPQSRAIYLNLRAEPYLATLLAGANSPLDLRGHAGGRLRRLHARIPDWLVPIYRLSLGELAAMSWLAETWTQVDLLATCPSALLAVDFDEFLGDVARSVAHICRHLGLDADERYLSNVASSPTLARYSKAMEFEYSPHVRGQLLADSRDRNAVEIGRGLKWLDELARREPQVEAVLAGRL